MQNTVKYYEYIWNSSIIKWVKKSALFISQNTHIPIEVLNNASSLDELSQTYAIPLKYVNTWVLGAIAALADEYVKGSSRSSNIIPSRMFNPSGYYPQKQRSQQLYTTCLNILNLETNHNSIDEVICILESGLIESDLYPLDNFPKLVKAIVNQTKGLDQWQFSQVSLAKLDGLERGSLNTNIRI